MEKITFDINALQADEDLIEAVPQAISRLSDLELALVGGGIGDTVL